MSTSTLTPSRSTSLLLGQTLTAFQLPDGDVWGFIGRLRHHPDAGPALTAAYRSSDNPSVKWSLVFVACQLALATTIPLLIEASTATATDDELARSAARMAAEALSKLV